MFRKTKPSNDQNTSEVSNISEAVNGVDFNYLSVQVKYLYVYRRRGVRRQDGS